MLRESVIELLADLSRRKGYISVATMQATPVWHANDPDVPLHLDMLGCMGSASSFALGLAIGEPARRVIAIDGDGCIMMQLGTLVTVAEARAANLTLIIMNNGYYETSGNQPIPGAQTADFVKLAEGAGFRQAVRITSIEELRDRAEELIEAEGPTLLSLDIDKATACDAWPALSMKAQIQATREAFLAARQSGGSA